MRGDWRLPPCRFATTAADLAMFFELSLRVLPPVRDRAARNRCCQGQCSSALVPVGITLVALHDRDRGPGVEGALARGLGPYVPRDPGGRGLRPVEPSKPSGRARGWVVVDNLSCAPWMQPR
jgi:hypothetical protein